MKQPVSFFFGLLLAGGVAAQAHAASVLLLGDNGGETQVQTALENAGHDVTLVTPYYDWDGINPNVADFDVVILLDGEDYGSPLEPAADAALERHVKNGCALVATEWVAYDVCGDSKSEELGALLPVSSDPDCDFDYSETWTVDRPDDPLAAGLPAQWTDDAGYSFVEPRPGATVIITGASGYPMLTRWDRFGGTVVHLNHDVTYSTTDIDANALQILINSASIPCQVIAPAPASSSLGLAAIAVLLLVAGAARLRRHADADV
jgi:hypothetical protein